LDKNPISIKKEILIKNQNFGNKKKRKFNKKIKKNLAKKFGQQHSWAKIFVVSTH